MSSETKFIVLTGYVSGLGKGSVGSSVGLLLKGYGLRVSAIKIDPYMNIDAGTMSPSEHGECYVLGDGYEGDLDLGNYERFIGINLTRHHNITSGQIYKEVIDRERRGEYLGKTVQIIPHITDHITERLEKAAAIPVEGPDGTVGTPDVVIVELGGSVGDMESESFFYALSRREFKKQCFFLHLGLLLRNNGELKTKLIQDSVKKLNQRGITPDVLCVRADIPSDQLQNRLRDKLSSSCSLDPEAIVVSGLVKSVYEIPKVLQSQHLQDMICRKFGLLWRGTMSPNFNSYLRILDHLENFGSLPPITVVIVAKYLDAPDTYLSLTRALEHASFRVGCQLKTVMIDAETFEVSSPPVGYWDAMIVPGGFGNRGTEGKMKAISFARQHQVPYLGICLGMQLMAVEHARSQYGWQDANSTEFEPDTGHPVVAHLSEYGEELVSDLGGTMRLGNQKLRFVVGTRAHAAYGGAEHAVERHRHRYEISKDFEFRDGLQISAFGAELHTTVVPEIIESTLDGWWAVGIQSHPEYISRNDRPHPLFVALLEQAVLKKENK